MCLLLLRQCGRPDLVRRQCIVPDCAYTVAWLQPLRRRALVLARDAAADQVAQRVHGGVADAVVDRRAARLAPHQALVHQEGQVPGDVGRGVAGQLRQLADVAFAGAQQVEDLQARGLGQGPEIRGHLVQGFGGETFHDGTDVGLGGQVHIMPHGVAS
jgi:hypothetical protein